MDSRSSKSQIKNRQSKITVRATFSGKVSRNPFINFLRDYRKSNKANVKLTELTRRGAQLWRGMTDREKSPYVNISKQAPRYKQNRRRGRRRRRRKRRRRSRSRSGSSSMNAKHAKNRRKTREERKEEHRRKERSASSGKKSDKGRHGSKEHATNSKKQTDEYEVKYKNSRYEDNRDFI